MNDVWDAVHTLRLVQRTCRAEETPIDLLDNPAIQAAALPFVVAALLSLALVRSRYLALAVLSGLIVVVGLTIGFAFEGPLSSVKKLIVATVALSFVGVLAEATGISARRAFVPLLSVAIGLVAVWVVQRLLQQREGTPAFLLGIGALAFSLVTAGTALLSGRESTLRASVVAACLGWGSGVLALIGASALLAQIGLALGTAAAAAALVQMLRGRGSPLGTSLIVPVAVAAPLIALLASATSELRWYALLPLPLAPLAGLYVPIGRLAKPWQAAFAIGAATLIPVVLAIALAWFAGASSPPAG